MKLTEIEANYKVGYRHSPKHFLPGTFQVEREGKRLVLVAIVKRHVGKRFRIVGVLKVRD